MQNSMKGCLKMAHHKHRHIKQLTEERRRVKELHERGLEYHPYEMCHIVEDHNRIRLIPRDELLDKLVDGTLHAPETAEGLKELQQAYNNLSEQIVILAKDLTIDFYNKLKEKDPKVEEAKEVLVHRFIDTLTGSIIAKTEIELGINNDIRGI